MTYLNFKIGTGRSKCCRCGNIIKRGEKEVHLRGWNVSVHYCYSCVTKEFNKLDQNKEGI